MKKLTKKQRHDIYKEALLISYDKSYPYFFNGLCHLFKDKFKIDVYYQYDIKEYNYDIMPELNLFIAEEYPILNWDDRRLILMFCIEMTR